MKISAISSTVERYLRTYPHLRDDDNKLLASIWINEIGGKVAGKLISATDFLEMLSKGKFPNSESVRRVRQKLQELKPELRGANYKARKAEENAVKQELKNLM